MRSRGSRGHRGRGFRGITGAEQGQRQGQKQSFVRHCGLQNQGGAEADNYSRGALTATSHPDEFAKPLTLQGQCASTPGLCL
ncbi:hypothetical protein MDS_0817 [Ectopseudomonas mendocina NK-01]|nr:hypothetical protein MDS_0817 [Pseudomonas mendocina NK-01]